MRKKKQKTKLKVQRKPGAQPLKAGDPTEKDTVRMPRSLRRKMIAAAKRKAEGNVSLYLRRLVRADLGLPAEAEAS